MLDLDIDPKLAWALKNRHRFPVDVNKADREMLLRVPGLGARAVDRIIAARRHTTLRLDDVARLTSSLKRARAFLVAADHHPKAQLDANHLRRRLVEKPAATEPVCMTIASPTSARHIALERRRGSRWLSARSARSAGGARSAGRRCVHARRCARSFRQGLRKMMQHQWRFPNVSANSSVSLCVTATPSAMRCSIG